MLIRTLPLSTPLTIPTEPLTPISFAPFGAVLTNPAPDLRPSAAASSPSSLPRGYGAVSANQGTAIQYRGLAPPLRDLYAQAPSGKAATPRTTMFVCGARELELESERGGGGSGDGSSSSSSAGLFTVRVLERHPFTTQTFIPLSSSSSSSPPAQYLVIVAPTLPPTSADNDLPVPEDTDTNTTAQTKLPGRGMPDLRRIRAFLATGSQAVTYGAGTWHAPMAALGPPGSAVDFVVVQFANDEPVEDCQEVALEGGGEGGPRIRVRVPGRKGEGSKL
ncbi:ureidoglycolate hydrolase [Daldinia vernicosa]|uniref:ureidoglycolate hydrolase n=1 Tax=Daldinia vernicosa TaxID=114800 RepID=UPI00200730F7|nr:ureidoglycolate hydrolase [Daldinia vernicosa]KAI0853260.1 ureidoglycolate hydrolase [Daldinia vernicosa]